VTGPGFSGDYSASGSAPRLEPPCVDCPGRPGTTAGSVFPPQQRSSFEQPLYARSVAPVPSYPPGAVPRPLTLSAVVVVTNRSRSARRPGLGWAKRIAARHNAVELILRSGPASQHPLAQHLVPRTSRPIMVVDLPEEPPPNLVDLLPEMPSDAHPVVHLFRTDSGRPSDAARKRNIAIAIGRLCGWETMLLLDDDMLPSPPDHADLDPPGSAPYDADPLHLDDALADLAVDPRVLAVGYDSLAFRDHSVVGHARRVLGRGQPGFMGAGALLLRCAGPLPFFTGGFNDDWLFMLALMLGGIGRMPSNVVKWGGSVYQQPYDPFDPARAMSEELGDLLAEGLFRNLAAPVEHLLGVGSVPGYWREAGIERQDEIFSLITHPRLRQCDPSGRIHRALAAAASVYPHAPSWADLLASYVRQWEEDLPSWRGRLAALTPAPSQELDAMGAIATLGLDRDTTWLGGDRGPFTALRGHHA
jgi:hypothetical protein